MIYVIVRGLLFSIWFNILAMVFFQQEPLLQEHCTQAESDPKTVILPHYLTDNILGCHLPKHTSPTSLAASHIPFISLCCAPGSLKSPWGS